MNEVKVPCGGFRLGGGLFIDPSSLALTASSLYQREFYWELSENKKEIEFSGVDFDTFQPVIISVPIDFNDKDHDKKFDQVKNICDKNGIDVKTLPLRFYNTNGFTNLRLSATGEDSIFDWGIIVRNTSLKKLQYIQVYIDSNGLHELITDIGTLS